MRDVKTDTRNNPTGSRETMSRENKSTMETASAKNRDLTTPPLSPPPSPTVSFNVAGVHPTILTYHQLNSTFVSMYLSLRQQTPSRENNLGVSRNPFPLLHDLFILAYTSPQRHPAFDPPSYTPHHPQTPPPLPHGPALTSRSTLPRPADVDPHHSH